MTQQASGRQLRLENEPYYHGLLPREDIKDMLRMNGDFLVRTTEPIAGQPRAFVLSVMMNSQAQEEGIKHFIVNRNPSGKFFIEKYSFESIPELIHYHWERNEPVTTSGDLKLVSPVIRQPWELLHDDIEVTRKLAFGEVSLGRLKLKNGVKIDVAIKLAKLESLKKEQIKEIMCEARLMRTFNHPNVVKLYGVAAGNEPLMLVMELADKGALDSFLLKNSQPPAKKLEMCCQAAWGIEYLHFKNVLHRDIAARNCLYGDNKVKISDFGLTREGSVFQMDPKNRVPIKWLSPETLRSGLYTQKSDVFAYGVLCWEIFNNGMEPYPGMAPAEVNTRVKTGYRMPLPDSMQAEMQTIVGKCWQDSVNDRMSMAQIARVLERITGQTAPTFDTSASVKEPKKPHHRRHNPPPDPNAISSAPPFLQSQREKRPSGERAAEQSRRPRAAKKRKRSFD